MKKIKECPFCGNKKAPTIALASENQEAGIDRNFRCVCCDFTNGGCGACGGYYENDSDAVGHWNKRAD